MSTIPSNRDKEIQVSAHRVKNFVRVKKFRVQHVIVSCRKLGTRDVRYRLKRQIHIIYDSFRNFIYDSCN